MRLVRYRADGGEHVGIEVEGGVLPKRFDNMIELMRSGKPRKRLATVCSPNGSWLR